MTLYTLTCSSVGNLILDEFDQRRTKVWLETNIESDAIIDSASVANSLRLGTAPVTWTGDDSFEFADLVPTNGVVNPTGFQYRVWIDYPLTYGDTSPRGGGKPGRGLWNSGWFSFTADAELADVVAEQYVPPTWMTTATAELQTYVDAAADISGIAVDDDIVEILVKNTGGAGPKTSAAIAAKIAASAVTPQLPAPTSGAGTSASPWAHADGTGGIATALTASRTSGKPVWVKAGHYAVTIAGTAILSDDRIHFEPGVILVVSGLASNANIFAAIGTSGTYKSGFVVTGNVVLDCTAQAATSVRGFNIEYCEDFQLDCSIRSKNGAGNPVRIINARGSWFVRRVARKTTETSGSAIFLQTTDGGHVASVYADGGDEALDLADCTGLIADTVTGVNCGEPVDIGSSRGCQIGKVYGYNNSQGVNFKIDAGVNATGCVGNHIDSVVMRDMQANVAAVTFTNTAEAVPCDDNTVGSLYARTTAANTTAVKFNGISAAAPVKRGRVGHLNFVGPETAVTYSKYTEGCHVGDENSYGETTGNFSAVLIADSGTDALTHYRPTVRGRYKATARTGSGNGAVTIMKTDGQGETVFDGHILGSGAEGIVTYKSKNLTCAGIVEECALSGWKHRVVDTADYTGDQNVSWRGTMRNVAKTTPSVDSGLRVVAESGTPTIRKVHVLPGSEFYDTQGSATTSVADFGTADFVTCHADVGRTLVGLILTATLPTTHDIKLTGRRTSLASTDDALSEIAALNNDGRVYTRTGVQTADATLYGNTRNLVSGASGARVMTLPTPKRAGQVIIVEKTDSGANTVTVSGSIRGSASSTVLSSQYETVEFHSTTSTWRPVFKGVVTV